MTRFIAIVGLVILITLAVHGQDEPKMLVPIPLPFNTDKDEDDPHPSSTHLLLYYASNANKKWELMTADRKTVKDTWSAGKPFTQLQSKEADIRSPFVMPDGKYPQKLYYSSNKDPEQPNRKSNNYDIYFRIKPDAAKDFTFDQAEVAVDTEADEMHPWISADGKNIYFSRKTEGGWRVFVSSRPPDGGQFRDPVKVNLPLGYHHATLTPDGKTMYLQGPVEAKGKGQRWGLFVSTTADNKVWTKPEPLSDLNHPAGKQGDVSPALSRDGTMLYFASDRPGGKGGLDIYAIPTVQLKKK